MQNQAIGILDSGVGGLSIWQEIVKLVPNESTVYVADSKNCPYGTRSYDEINHLSSRLVRFLRQQQVKVIVLACNTITVSSLSYLRDRFASVAIVGTVPVVKTATERTVNGKIGILSTVTTAESVYQKELIAKFAKDKEVLNIGTDLLVPYVEKGEVKGERVRRVLEKILAPFRTAGIDVLALGCSHFPFLREEMQILLGSNILVLDSGAAIARQVIRVLTANNMLHASDPVGRSFYTTGNQKEFSDIATALVGKTLGVTIRAESVNL